MTIGVNALNANGTTTVISEVTVVKEGSDVDDDDDTDDIDDTDDVDDTDDTDDTDDINGEVITFDVNMTNSHWQQISLDVDISTFNINLGDNLTITCPGAIYISTSWGTMTLDCEDTADTGLTISECEVTNTGSWTN